MAVPEYGVAVGGGGTTGATGATTGLTRSHVRFPTALGPLLMKTTFISWAPAFSVTVFETVAQVCQPPVLGIVRVPVALTPPNSTRNVPPWSGDATRASSR